MKIVIPKARPESDKMNTTMNGAHVRLLPLTLEHEQIHTQKPKLNRHFAANT